MNIAALIIGRGNNTLKDKNILPVLGKPLLQWGGLAAKHSKYVNSFFISSDDIKILMAGREIGFMGIIRPESLATPTSQSSDVVIHSLKHIEEQVGEIDILVVIHANVGTISSKMIDDCIEILLEKKCSSVIPSHYKYEYHPRRAKKVNANGTLVNYIGEAGEVVSANRQDLDACVFFDHSFWVLDVKKGVKSKDGQYPWPVMGNNIYPYITEGCFDVHDLEDLKRTERWLILNNIGYDNI